MVSQQRRQRRSAGKLEGNQENGVLPKSMQGNISRRECVSGSKAVFNFGRAWNSNRQTSGLISSPPRGKSLLWQDSCLQEIII